MSTNKQANDWFWALIVASVIVVFVSNAYDVATRPKSSGVTPAINQTDQEDFAHRYTKERIKLEGYNDADATKAADAIMKFQKQRDQRIKEM
jgi:hypothetical protein